MSKFGTKTVIESSAEADARRERRMMTFVFIVSVAVMAAWTVWASGPRASALLDHERCMETHNYMSHEHALAACR